MAYLVRDLTEVAFGVQMHGRVESRGALVFDVTLVLRVQRVRREFLKPSGLHLAQISRSCRRLDCVVRKGGRKGVD